MPQDGLRDARLAMPRTLQVLSEALDFTGAPAARLDDPRHEGQPEVMDLRTRATSRALILLRTPSCASRAESASGRDRSAPGAPTMYGRQAAAKPRDAQVERAITLMRVSLDKRWTVSSLARAVGLSRPAFARRFVASEGLSPLRYLTRLRMERAAR